MLPDTGRHGSEGSGRTVLYFSWMTLFIYLARPAGALIHIQTLYILKSPLHASATQTSR